MPNRIATIASIAIVVFAITAVASFAAGRYMIAGTCFVLLSCAIYVRETRT